MRPGIPKTLRGLWMVLFGAFKVAVGAAATVAIIGMVCFMVLANATGDYLQEDIIPERASIWPRKYRTEPPGSTMWTPTTISSCCGSCMPVPARRMLPLTSCHRT